MTHTIQWEWAIHMYNHGCQTHIKGTVDVNVIHKSTIDNSLRDTKHCFNYDYEAVTKIRYY